MYELPHEKPCASYGRRPAAYDRRMTDRGVRAEVEWAFDLTAEEECALGALDAKVACSRRFDELLRDPEGER